MATVGHYPPAGENLAKFGSLPGVRFTEGVTFAVDGSDAMGPEAAGAVLVLQGALDNDDKAQQFWSRAASTLRDAQASPGFIRFIGFGDGLSNYALGFWRTYDDAMAFFQSASHTAAMRELDETGNQYTHFAALFKTERVHDRHVYCESCGVRNVMPIAQCTGCGNALVDVFKVPAGMAPAAAP